jgi:hypothetical protein
MGINKDIFCWRKDVSKTKKKWKLAARDVK